MATSRRRAVSIALVALLAALIAGSLRLRQTTKNGATEVASQKSPVPPRESVVDKKPTAWDFPRKTGMRVTALAEGEKPDPDSPPHPLDAEIAARTARWKAWRLTSVDLKYSDTSLKDVLADLTSRYGLKFIVSPELELDEKTVTFKVDQLPADQALDLIFKMADLPYTIASDGSMAVADSRENLAPWEIKDSDELRRLEETIAAGDHQGREARQDAANAAYLESIKDKALTQTVGAAQVWESISGLQEDLKVNIVMSVIVRKELSPDSRIPDLPAGRSLAATLDTFTKAADMDWMAWNGVIFIGTKEEIAADTEKLEKSRSDRKQRESGLASLLARTVEIGGENLAIRDVADLLGQSLGVPVRLDPITWHRAARLSFDRASRPASEIVKAMQSAAPIRVVLVEGTLWFLGPPPPTAPD